MVGNKVLCGELERSDGDLLGHYYYRSQWPRGLRRGFAATRLLRLWVRMPLGHGCLSVVSIVCCQVEVSASGWSLIQRSPTECVVSECDLESSIVRRPWPTRTVASW